MRTIAALATVLLLAASLAGLTAAAQTPYYPCKTCHVALNVTGMVRSEPFHGIDLTRGAHRGLYCASCHVPPLMQQLVGGAEVRIPGIHTTEELKETNIVCSVCHPRVFEDYNLLVHGNKTMVCEGGEMQLVRGYKGVVYNYHVCPDYRNLETVPAKACIQCHNPHDPTMPALPALPPPSDRPSPPDQTPIAWSGFAVLVGSLTLAAAALTGAARSRSKTPHGER